MNRERDEIPKDDWSFFLDGYSRQHDGWLVTVETQAPGAEPLVRAHSVPFGGLVFGADSADESVTVIVGAEPDRHVAIGAGVPSRILLDRSPVDRGGTLEIVAGDGTITRVRVDASALPEEVDGLA